MVFLMIEHRRSFLAGVIGLIGFWAVTTGSHVHATATQEVGVAETRSMDDDDHSTPLSSRVIERVDYTRDIRPLLSDRCFACHGPDQASREGGFRLDLKESVMTESDSGNRVVAPGRPSESELLRRIMSDEPEEAMPPADSGKKRLSKNEIDLIKAWIEQGADWKNHWSFEPLVRPGLPTHTDPTWSVNEIDEFALARMERNGLSPSPAADKQTVLRRVAFDLTGLPPSIQAMDSFMEDESPEAYERVVDRLLASDRYGEHMARFWLDAARYGDTHGMHMDNYREMWPYRDWVVRAFNSNMRYDDFTIAQLAGDLLPDPTVDQLVATGFNRSHVSTNEGGSIYEEVYVRNVADRVVTTGTVFLGLTLECTRCHDHKFDPLTQADFYSMSAFFNSLDGAEMDGNTNDSAPVIHVPTADQAARLDQFVIERMEIAKRARIYRRQKETEFQQWCREHLAAPEDSEVELDSPSSKDFTDRYSFQRADAARNGEKGLPRPFFQNHGDVNFAPGRLGDGIRLSKNGYVDLSKTFKIDHRSTATIAMWAKIPNGRTGSLLSKSGRGGRGYALRVENGDLALYLTNRPESYGIRVVTNGAGIDDGRWHYLTATYDGCAEAAGVTLYVDGRRQEVRIKLDSVAAKGSFQDFSAHQTPLLLGMDGLGEHDDNSNLDGVIIDELRLCKRELSTNEVVSMMTTELATAALAVEAETRSVDQINDLRNYYFHQLDTRSIELSNEIDRSHRDQRKLLDSVASTLVFRERAEPTPAFVLERGVYDQLGAPVFRVTPTALPPMKPGLPPNRLGFAQWLVDREHPLTSRVAVNRFWAQFFGAGIVKTIEDFGSQGDIPSHPQLLDWLSVELIESGWDIKAMVKMIVMSKTYRQSSARTPELNQRDPENRLLARGPRFRLDAEMIRDQALWVSGLMVEQLGGPGVKPPQPQGLWKAVAMKSSNTNQFKADKRPQEIYRRTLYTFIKRTAPPPQMSTFDAPSRESCSVRRERTNTPLQALLLLNDPQYFAAARALARRAMDEGGPSTEGRIRFMLRACTGKIASQAAVRELTEYFTDQLAIYQSNPESAARMIDDHQTHLDLNGQTELPGDPTELASWTMVANLVLNLDSVVTKN